MEDKLLSYVRKNAALGLMAVPKLLEKSDDLEFSRKLYEREKEYRRILCDTECDSDDNVTCDNELNGFEKYRAEMMLNIGSLPDVSTSQLAEIVVVNSTMGAIDITRQLRRYPHASRKAKTLAVDLLEIEENGISQMKRYL